MLPKHKDRISRTHVKAGVVALQCWGGGERRVPGGNWPTSLAAQANSRFRYPDSKPKISEEPLRKTPEVGLWLSFTHMCICKHL